MSQESAISARDSEKEVFAELRGLLLAPEQEEIRRIKQDLENTHRAEGVSRVLPEAMRLAAQRNQKLRSALQPVLEQSLRASVRRDPSILSDALFPIIGQAVKKAVSAAFRQLADSLNQTMEQRFTMRSVLWRVEAARTGKSYGEIALVRSVLYRVEQVFLIHRETGLLLSQRSAESTVIKDGDLISAMLTAIQDFVKDSFGEPVGDTLEAIEAGEFLIWVQRTDQAILAAVIRGVPPKALKGAFEKVLQGICSSRAGVLASFNGDVAPFKTCKEDLAACFLGEGKRATSRIPWPLWVVPACIAILLGVWAWFSFQQTRRWQDFVATLKQQPGIVVTEASRRGGKYVVSGLRDPFARDPALLLGPAGFATRDVSFDWQNYRTLQQPLAAMHDFEDLRKRVESRKIYFATDKSEISSEQLGVVEDAAQEIHALLGYAKSAGKKIQIEIIPHTDNSGTEARNAKLLDARAAEVAAFLVASGVAPEVLLTESSLTRSSAAGAPADLNAEDGRKSAIQRNVSFHIRPIES